MYLAADSSRLHPPNRIKVNDIVIVAVKITLLMFPVFALLSGCTVPENSPQPSPTPSLNPGEEARLVVSNVDRLYVANDEDLYDEFRKAIDIKDAYGMLELFQRGKIFEADNDIKVLLLERGTTLWVTTRWKIRVLEGTNLGKAGWVHHSWISR